MIDAINAYPPEAALNGVAFAGFVVGFVAFGVAMAKTATFPRSPGLLRPSRRRAPPAR
jgi:hypothetical protein